MCHPARSFFQTLPQVRRDIAKFPSNELIKVTIDDSLLKAYEEQQQPLAPPPMPIPLPEPVPTGQVMQIGGRPVQVRSITDYRNIVSVSLQIISHPAIIPLGPGNSIPRAAAAAPAGGATPNRILARPALTPAAPMTPSAASTGSASVPSSSSQLQQARIYKLGGNQYLQVTVGLGLLVQPHVSAVYRLSAAYRICCAKMSTRANLSGCGRWTRTSWSQR